MSRLNNNLERHLIMGSESDSKQMLSKLESTHKNYLNLLSNAQAFF